MEYIEKTIFAIEKENGKKIVHFLGYRYYGEGFHDNNKKLRFVEYTHAYMELSKVIKSSFESSECAAAAFVNQYITDCTLEELERIYETYDNGRKPKEISSLSEDIPEGCYIYMGSSE